MTKETAKAIADVTKKVNEVERKLNEYLEMQLEDRDMALFELANLVAKEEEPKNG